MLGPLGPQCRGAGLGSMLMLLHCSFVKPERGNAGLAGHWRLCFQTGPGPMPTWLAGNLKKYPILSTLLMPRGRLGVGRFSRLLKQLPKY